LNKDIETSSNACNKLCSHYGITRQVKDLTFSP
jgi:hypothetical protein